METAKGSIILAARRSAEQTLGAEGYARVLTQLPPAARELISSPSLVPSGRYPMERVAEMLGALGRHWGPSRLERLEELGRFVAVKQLNGMLKFLLRLGSVSTTVSMLPKAWELFFQGSSSRVIDRGPNRFRSVTRSAFLGELLAAALRGFLRELIEQAGGRQVEIKEIPSQAPDELHLEVRWS
jgi:hypothetical protein